MSIYCTRTTIFSVYHRILVHLFCIGEMGYKGMFKLWAICFLFKFCLQAQTSNSQNLSCNPSDFRALQRFLVGFESGIDGWNISNSSASSHCCDWGGITCDSSGRVVKLELSKQRLSGKISESLGDLGQLRILNLSTNFMGGQIPESLFSLPNLSDNGLSGAIPTVIHLPSVTVLNVSSNSLGGSIPARICRSLTRIEVIDFSDNFFSGSFPAGFGNCIALQHLSLGSNLLTAVVPEDVFRLPELTHLRVGDNSLSGKLSDGIGNLSNLVVLDLSMNMLSGSIPDVFHSLPKLVELSLYSNNFNGQIPPSLSSSRSLTSLALRNNSLSGPIQMNCSRMTSLELSSNKFSGPLPDLSLCPRLKSLSLGRNNFTGQIPESFRNSQSLSYLSLTNCSISNLSAALDILQDCQDLTTLVLSLSFRGEQLPSDPSLNFTSLKALVIGNSRLTGEIPGWISRSRGLQLLDLSWNQLTGPIPGLFSSTFEHLFYVDLSNNSLSGEIPKNLTELPSLVSRNMSQQDNSMSFPFFRRKDQGYRSLQYNNIWSFPPTLDLSDNKLEGPICPEFGKLQDLHVLDLGGNQLTGTIPSSLSNMRNIESLDFSHNNLSGTVPGTLARLSFLSWFSVAYNQLHGIIPSGGQFTTFPNSSFVGNPGLCYQNSSSCSNTEQVPTESLPHDDSKRMDTMIIAVFVGVGIGVGFGIGFWVGWSDRIFRIAPRSYRLPDSASVYSLPVPKTSLKVIISLSR